VALQIAFIPDLVAILRLEESHRLSPLMTVRASAAEVRVQPRRIRK